MKRQPAPSPVSRLLLQGATILVLLQLLSVVCAITLDLNDRDLKGLRLLLSSVPSFFLPDVVRSGSPQQYAKGNKSAIITRNITISGLIPLTIPVRNVNGTFSRSTEHLAYRASSLSLSPPFPFVFSVPDQTRKTFSFLTPFRPFRPRSIK